MATNLDLDDDLIQKVVKAGNFKSKKEALNTIMADYLRRKGQKSLLELAGKIHYGAGYDHKKLRSRKAS